MVRASVIRGGWWAAVHWLADKLLPSEYGGLGMRESADADTWAREFCRVAKTAKNCDLDPKWVAGWFHNAIESGRRSEAAETFLRDFRFSARGK